MNLCKMQGQFSVVGYGVAETVQVTSFTLKNDSNISSRSNEKPAVPTTSEL